MSFARRILHPALRHDRFGLVSASCFALLLTAVACQDRTASKPPASESNESEAATALPELSPEFLASLPEDTVFLVEDRPITQSEVDAWLETFAWVEPAKSQHALRRFIVTNYSMPVAVAQALDPEGRARAKDRIERVRAKLLAGEPLSLEDPQPETLQDNYQSKLGLDRVGIARQTTMGEWSEVFETLGGYTMVRLLGAPDPWLPDSEVIIEHITVSYLPPEESKEIVKQAIPQAQIRVIDPEWRRYMPTVYLHQARLPVSGQVPEASESNSPSE